MLSDDFKKIKLIKIDPKFKISNFILSNNKINDEDLNNDFSEYSIRDLGFSELKNVHKQKKLNCLKNSCFEKNDSTKENNSFRIKNPNKLLKYKYHYLEFNEKIQPNKLEVKNKKEDFKDVKNLSVYLLKRLEYYYFKHETWNTELIKKISKKLKLSIYLIYKFKIYKDI